MSGVGLPLSYVLAFQFNMGVVGLCIGTTVGTFVHMSLYLLIVSRTNWMKESSKVQYVLKKEAFKRKYPTAKYIEDRYARTVCTEKNDYFMLIIFPYCTIHHLLSSLYQQFTCKYKDMCTNVPTVVPIHRPTTPMLN